MRLIKEETSLVVAGAWNPAILTPQWVIEHGLKRPSGERIQAYFPAGLGGIFDPPKFQVGDFSFVVRPDALIVAPSESDQAGFELVEGTVAAILELLRYTPLTGLGHNFEFRDSSPDPQHFHPFTVAREDLGDKLPGSWLSAATGLITSFRSDDGNVILTIQRSLDASTIAVKFNFHYPLADTNQALMVLKGQQNYQRMEKNFAIARELIASVYGEVCGDE